MGKFATGVTVVTTTNDAGEPIGLTANSFTSVSLEPPLVLWNLGDHCNCYDDFKNTSRFVIHILDREQENLSTHFASSSEDKFNLIEWEMNERGLPVLAECSISIECSVEEIYPGGDHLIMLGRVEHFYDRGADDSPLIFYQGKYASLV